MFIRRAAGRKGPRSLAARTSILLIVGLGIVQAAGLAIHAIDHVQITDQMAMHEAQIRISGIYRTIVESPPEIRPQVAANLRAPPGFSVELSDHPDPHARGEVYIMLPPLLRQRSLEGRLLANRPPADDAGRPPEGPSGEPGSERGPIGVETDHVIMPRPKWPAPMFLNLPESLWPRHIRLTQGGARRRAVSLALPDEPRWVIVRFRLPASSLFGSWTFLAAFGLMTICGGSLIVWGANRLIAPVGTLARAAQALGRNVDAPPLPEDGPSEIRQAAIAFNTMASRIRRFVTDRTLMLTAIGHDLRTPITRLKLRAEFIDDDELREKFLADLDEMEAMVASTLAFGRDSASREPVASLDLTALLQTIADEACESYPDLSDAVSFDAPEHAIITKAQSLALKRALSNLVINAIKYGHAARIVLNAPKRCANGETAVEITIDDQGPGLPESELERMFEPFVRAETSRNRETGGTGLGLSIARTVLRGQGGDVVLLNRAEGGLRARVTLLV